MVGENGYNWICLRTRPRLLIMDITVKAGLFKTEELAKLLNVDTYDSKNYLTDKLAMGNSVLIKNRNFSTDRIRLRIKDSAIIGSAKFKKLLADAMKTFTRLDGD